MISKHSSLNDDPVLQIVQRSNQRGGRMLSVIDLIDAGTVTVELTAWMLERIENGRSFLVGAKPGGAGKTTVMGAFLSLLPQHEKAWLTDSATPWREQSGKGNCLVAYEISPGNFHAYIWGEPVAKMLELGQSGARVVTNLHADTLEQAREQVVNDNGIAPELFDQFGTFLGIDVAHGLRGSKRVVRRVHYFEDGDWKEWTKSTPLSERAEAILEFLEDLQGKGINRLEDVRREWLTQAAASG
jgi:hypothetical protein